MPTCKILQGIPGSGKSTYANSKQCEGYVICSADDYHMVDGVYQWIPANVPKAHEWCFTKFCDAINKGQDVVVDNTNLTPGEYMKYYNEASMAQYAIEFHTFVCSVETSVKRNKHNVPRETIERMFGKLDISKHPANGPGRWHINPTEPLNQQEIAHGQRVAAVHDRCPASIHHEKGATPCVCDSLEKAYKDGQMSVMACILDHMDDITSHLNQATEAFDGEAMGSLTHELEAVQWLYQEILLELGYEK